MHEARAGFLFDFASQGNFQVINSGANGNVNVQNGGIILTGGNDQSGNPGTTDFLGTATSSGMFLFDWSYSSLDTPTFDYAGFLLNGIFFPLADTDGQFGLGSFEVLSGQTLGFRVGTLDNQGEPGVLTIANIDSVPEPGTGLLLLTGGIAVVCRWGLRSSRRSARLWRRGRTV